MGIKRNIPWSEVVTVANKHTDWFRFIPDINKWVRVIQRGGGDFPEEIYIELHPDNLHSTDADWSGVRDGLVKTTQVFGSPNYYHHYVPKKVVDRMILQLGERFTNVLLNIDLVKRTKHDRDYLRLLPRMREQSPIFEQGVPLVLLCAPALSNKDHAMLLNSLSGYYGSYYQNEANRPVQEVTELEATGFAYAFKKALAQV